MMCDKMVTSVEWRLKHEKCSESNAQPRFLPITKHWKQIPQLRDICFWLFPQNFAFGFTILSPKLAARHYQLPSGQHHCFFEQRRTVGLTYSLLWANMSRRIVFPIRAYNRKFSFGSGSLWSQRRAITLPPEQTRPVFKQISSLLRGLKRQTAFPRRFAQAPQLHAWS